MTAAGTVFLALTCLVVGAVLGGIIECRRWQRAAETGEQVIGRRGNYIVIGEPKEVSPK